MAKAMKKAAKKSKVTPNPKASKLRLLKSAAKKVAKITKQEAKGLKPKKAQKPPQQAGPGKNSKAATSVLSQKREAGFLGPMPDKPLPRASKLPPMAAQLNKREMEQLLTAGMGRGVEGEGGLKGRLIVREGFPYLQVVGRDKRELVFLLQGPEQEVLPACIEHKVSVSGRIRKTTNYGGTVDVRKYSAKKPEPENDEPAVAEEKLKFLSPGDVVQLCNAGMGAGMKGFAAIRGGLEMTGDNFFLVVANPGTRHQVSFVLQGKIVKSLRKNVGQTVEVTGVVEKNTGWGGTIQVETAELRASDHRPVSREGLIVTQVVASGDRADVAVALNQGLEVVFIEKPGFTWAIEPAMAKRIGLREANYKPLNQQPAKREFFFTPRTPGAYEVEFFLAKAFSPTQVEKTFRLCVTVT